MTYETIKDLYDAIQDGDASVVDLFDFVNAREMAALQRGLDTMTNLVQRIV